jgi:hypothetical protein
LTKNAHVTATERENRIRERARQEREEREKRRERERRERREKRERRERERREGRERDGRIYDWEMGKAECVIG